MFAALWILRASAFLCLLVNRGLDKFNCAIAAARFGSPSRCSDFVAILVVPDGCWEMKVSDEHFFQNGQRKIQQRTTRILENSCVRLLQQHFIISPFVPAAPRPAPALAPPSPFTMCAHHGLQHSPSGDSALVVEHIACWFEILPHIHCRRDGCPHLKDRIHTAWLASDISGHYTACPRHGRLETAMTRHLER